MQDDQMAELAGTARCKLITQFHTNVSGRRICFRPFFFFCLFSFPLLLFMTGDLWLNLLFEIGRSFFWYGKNNGDPAPGGNLIRDRLIYTHTPGLLISPIPSALSVCGLQKQCLSAATRLSGLVINALAEGSLLSLYRVPKPTTNLTNQREHLQELPICRQSLGFLKEYSGRAL